MNTTHGPWLLLIGATLFCLSVASSGTATFFAVGLLFGIATDDAPHVISRMGCLGYMAVCAIVFVSSLLLMTYLRKRMDSHTAQHSLLVPLVGLLAIHILLPLVGLVSMTAVAFVGIFAVAPGLALTCVALKKVRYWF